MQKFKQFNGLLEMGGVFRIGLMMDENNSHLTTCYFAVDDMAIKTVLTDMHNPRFHTMLKNTLRSVFGQENDQFQNKPIIMVFEGDSFSYHTTEELHSETIDDLTPLYVDQEQSELIRSVSLMVMHEHFSFLSYRINQGFTLGHIIDEYDKIHEKYFDE